MRRGSSYPSNALSVFSASSEVRRRAISVLLREDGLKPRMGLINGRDAVLSKDLADNGSAGLCSGCDFDVRGDGEEAICCEATHESVVDVVSISNLYDPWVIIAGGGPFSKPLFLRYNRACFVRGLRVVVLLAWTWERTKAGLGGEMTAVLVEVVVVVLGSKSEGSEDGKLSERGME